MNILRKTPRTLTTLGVAALLTVVGCGDDGLGKRYSVTGTVTYKGEKVKIGSINFINEKADADSANGEIKDGYFSLSTRNPGDGAFPGKYTVTIDAKDVDTAGLMEKAKAKGATSGMIPQDIAAKAKRDAKSLVPEKYGRLDSTPLKSQEVKTQSNTFTYDLVD